MLDLPLKETEEASRGTEGLRFALDVASLLNKRMSDHEQPKLGTIAKAMGMSARTLQRRLKYGGVDFEDLLDQTRRVAAFRLISEGKHTMTEIAYTIGYSDPAHFTRAFKRWTGAALPSRYLTLANNDL